ncbi:hypothetical protein D6777_03855 [Candidatus Woesearchaeota archaeon]|nr:MAG: hypothetical protein D6777_03855 [Candidatus Woesearchaeota archaeon]
MKITLRLVLITLFCLTILFLLTSCRGPRPRPMPLDENFVPPHEQEPKTLPQESNENQPKIQEQIPQSRVKDLNINGKYLLVFHACDSSITQCDPRNHKVYLSQSNDGEHWNVVENWEPFSGSVPDIIRRGDFLYIYTSRNELVRYDLKNKLLYEPQKVTIQGSDIHFVDPSLFIDDKGRLVLFFLYGRKGSDPASCPPNQESCDNVIGSATEVEGSEGKQFILDEGNRIKVHLDKSSKWRSASDPDIFFDGSQYVLYLSHGPSISVWTSPTLRGEYSMINELSTGTGGVPAGYYDASNKNFWTFSHINKNGASVIRRAVHKSLSDKLNENDWDVVLDGLTIGQTSTTNVESPGFAVNEA